MANEIWIPFPNPVRFYETTRANLPKFFTRHFDEWMFEERILDWQQQDESTRIWQTTDIAKFQFESTFDPITVSLITEDGQNVISQPALISLQNIDNPQLKAFEVTQDLQVVTQTGCYRFMVTLGASGPQQVVLISNCQYISTEQIRNSMLIQYWHSKFHADVMYETGIKFEVRMMGHIGPLDPGTANEFNRDQRYNPALLNSRQFRRWPIIWGDEYGITDDDIDLLNFIWGHDNVRVDNKAFGAADGAKFEFTELDPQYTKRGCRLVVEEGINRNSRIFAVNTDTTKKLMASIIVDRKATGDHANAGSNNAVPVINEE